MQAFLKSLAGQDASKSASGAESALDLGKLGLHAEGLGGRVDHPLQLHPTLTDFLARGGMTALVASSLASRRRNGCVGVGCAVPGKRELDPQPVDLRKERISTG